MATRSSILCLLLSCLPKMHPKPGWSGVSASCVSSRHASGARKRLDHPSGHCRLQRRRVVWLTQRIDDVLGVGNAVGSIKHKDCLRELSPLFEPHAIVPPELLTAMSGEHLVQHALGLLPARLHLRWVHTHAIEARLCWQLDTKRLPLLDHLLAERRRQAVHHAQQTDLPT